ncbi:MAG: hypothetical protein C5B49_05805 [Bdellovibrio sp.]|nr:MAG: hypothetical protein C5B49_05805 [Bdellovibrio sp.]
MIQPTFSQVGLLLLLATLAGEACSRTGGADNSSSAPNQNSEKPYNSTPTTYTGPTTTITATAIFNRYEDGVAGLQTITTGHPIRFAEVYIFDAAGNRIQQGETDGVGNISMVIPKAAGTYTLAVNSRAANSHYNASVLNNPYDNLYYSHSTTFTLAGSETNLAVTLPPADASNNSDLLGGAFNILDQILVANDYLRTEANISCPICTGPQFTVAPKLQIYWTKGLSPGTYYGAPSTGISFFTKGGGALSRGLYILGGINNSVCTDTDHFDNSVILHEYGHFLEFSFGKSASPGGSHNGNELLDPRLAWSEGWADFFQAAALGRSYYRDTEGNSGCSNYGVLINFDLENQLIGEDDPLANEGIFRELAITRTLYDVMTGPTQDGNYNNRNDTDGYAADLGFNFIWAAFQALGSGAYHFQNAGIVNELLNANVQNSSYSNTTRTNFSSVEMHEKQQTDETLYGLRLKPTVAGQGSCFFTFAAGGPQPQESSGGQIIFSDPLRNNAFYRYDYDGNPANAVLYLRYKNTSGSAPYDLNLNIYFEDYVLLEASTLAAQSANVYPEPGGSGPWPGYEHVDLTALPAGTYLINVMVNYSGAQGTTSYFIETPRGAQLCP